MNPKYKNPYWHFIGIWFIVFAILAGAILFSPPILDINLVIVFLGFFSMLYCAAKEEDWFPSGDPNDG